MKWFGLPRQYRTRSEYPKITNDLTTLISQFYQPLLLAKTKMHRYALRSATNTPGIVSLDPLTPHHRASSELYVPRPSPELEPKGVNPGVPPFAVPRSYCDVAMVRMPTPPAPMGAGGTQQQTHTETTTVCTPNRLKTLCQGNLPP